VFGLAPAIDKKKMETSKVVPIWGYKLVSGCKMSLSLP